MKKYIKEIKISGLLLMLLGIISYRLFSLQAGVWMCIIGIALWMVEIVYKALNWEEYRKDNTQNIIIMILVIELAVDQWIKEYGVRYFSELTNMAVLTEEVGELAKIMARRYGEQSWKPSDERAKDNGQQALGDEMADVLWVLLCLANQTGVDLTEEMHKNLEKKTLRDKERHKNNEKLKTK